MERLTFEGNFCDIAQCESVPGGSYCESGSCSQREVWERLKAYEDTGLTPEEVDEMQRDWSDLCTIIGECGGLDRIRELARADGEGCVVVPCKVGDTVWAILDGAKYARECKVDFVNIGSVGTTIVFAAKKLAERAVRGYRCCVWQNRIPDPRGIGGSVKEG